MIRKTPDVTISHVLEEGGKAHGLRENKKLI